MSIGYGFAKRSVFSFFVNKWRDVAECTSSGKSFKMFRESSAKLKLKWDLKQHTFGLILVCVVHAMSMFKKD